jgi:cystathionine gamma-synthase
MKFETRAIHAGRLPQAGSSAVAPNLVLSSTFMRAADGSYPEGFSYSRAANPNRSALEQCLAALEGGDACAAFASGSAATYAILQALAPDDHVIIPDDVYHGTRTQLRELLARWHLRFSEVDLTRPERLRAALTPATRLLWIETPSNPLLKITDIAASTQVAHEAGAAVVVDNTFASPVLQQPLALGADLVLHSTSKYLGGHSDIVGGAVISWGDSALFQRIRAFQAQAGAVPAPFDCWLLLRSIATLPQRVRAQTDSARRIAGFLADHPRVAAVHYPGLPRHPGHEIAERQMSAPGAMLSLQMGDGRDAALALAARLQLFTRATSLGGVESLIEHRASVEGPHSSTPDDLLRMSVGLEHADDLIADLGQALDALS